MNKTVERYYKKIIRESLSLEKCRRCLGASSEKRLTGIASFYVLNDD
jgi:hypothetical protein